MVWTDLYPVRTDNPADTSPVDESVNTRIGIAGEPLLVEDAASNVGVGKDERVCFSRNLLMDVGIIATMETAQNRYFFFTEGYFHRWEDLRMTRGKPTS